MVAHPLSTVAVASIAFWGCSSGRTLANDRDSRAEIGFALAEQLGIALDHDNPALGLGSYLVNANNSCNDCHTQPNYAPGGDPYSRQPKQVPLTNFLAGGRLFTTATGNFCSRNITPEPGTSKPAGLSRKDFLYVMQTGCDPQDANFHNPQTCGLLQVMPWPNYRNMKPQELNAIYSFLAALPSGSPGPQCVPDQQGIVAE